jgi:hypothetical protein
MGVAWKGLILAAVLLLGCDAVPTKTVFGPNNESIIGKWYLQGTDEVWLFEYPTNHPYGVIRIWEEYEDSSVGIRWIGQWKTVPPGNTGNEWTLRLWEFWILPRSGAAVERIGRDWNITFTVTAGYLIYGDWILARDASLR